MGNPGTGKTMFSTIWASFLFFFNLVKKPTVVQIKVAQLIGSVLGETTKNTTVQAINPSKDGVLILDEAHALAMEDQYMEELLRVIFQNMSGGADDKTNLGNEEQGQTTIIFCGYKENKKENKSGGEIEGPSMKKLMESGLLINILKKLSC